MQNAADAAALAGAHKRGVGENSEEDSIEAVKKV